LQATNSVWLLQWFTNLESTILASPNYGYEKRQRELAKKKKKEEKQHAKTQRKQDDGPSDAPVAQFASVAQDPVESGSAPSTSAG
jgi:hypothetical protein